MAGCIMKGALHLLQRSAPFYVFTYPSNGYFYCNHLIYYNTSQAIPAFPDISRLYLPLLFGAALNLSSSA